MQFKNTKKGITMKLNSLLPQTKKKNPKITENICSRENPETEIDEPKSCLGVTHFTPIVKSHHIYFSDHFHGQEQQILIGYYSAATPT